jgi:hypothetical protein
MSSKKPPQYSQAIRLLLVGFATDKAKNIDVWERICLLPSMAEAEAQLSKDAKTVSLWNDEGRNLPRRMKPKESKTHGVEYVAAVASIRPHVEARVSANIAGLLAEPDSAWPQAVDEYRRRLPAVASSLSPGFTTRALKRRNEIASALPDMTPRQEPEPRKPKAKKGADK